ncbi:MAG: hypothetical protein WAT12_08665 [Candidatus Nitrotoga sp.]
MFRFVGSYREVPTFCNTTAPATKLTSLMFRVLKVPVRKRGPIERFVQNQKPTIRPCGLFQAPAGSCGKVRNPALTAVNPTSSHLSWCEQLTITFTRYGFRSLNNLANTGALNTNDATLKIYITPFERDQLRSSQAGKECEPE